MPTCHLWILPLLLLPLACGVGLAKEDAPTGDTGVPKANNAFAWDLYAAVRADAKNLFFSPYSITTALAMTREGARGETAAAMDTVLHLAGITPSDGNRKLIAALTPPLVREGHGRSAKQVPAYEFNVANRLWGHKGLTFEDAFTQTLAKAYGAPLERIDFGNPGGARKRINDWVEQRTKGKIKNLIPSGMPPPLTRLVLANAIYYKAQWAEAFYERGTHDGDFFVSSGEKMTARLMHKQHAFPYVDLGAAHAVELPYRGHATSMVVLLPKARDGLAALEQSLCEGKLAGWEQKLVRRSVDVKLPKFEFTQALDLAGTLQGLGMELAFHPTKADFSGMTTKEPLCIGAVLHKAFIAVDENGTEAAAATAVMMKLGAAPGRPEEPVKFHADHPFIFLIRHNATGAILFMGRVMEPKTP